jgi:phenylacetate-CoA ligase
MYNKSIDDWLLPLAGRYVQSPQWIKSIAGNIYAQLPLRLRFGKSYSFFREAFELGNVGRIDEYRKAALCATLSYAIKQIPAYQNLGLSETDIKTDPLKCLLRFPISGKSTIKANPSNFLPQCFDPANRITMSTGGSTAEPMHFYLSRGTSRSKEWAAFDVMNEALGDRANETVLALRGRTVPSADKYDGQLWMYEPIKRHLILSSDHLESRYMQRYIEAIRLYKPTRIHAFASALYPLARWLKENPEPSLINNFKGVVLTSESVFDFQLTLFQEVFNCPIIRHYGHSERVVMAYTKPNDERYHFLPQYGWTELVDPNGNSITEAGVLGEIVGTSFDNWAMPFVRYRTGDLAELAVDQGDFSVGSPICSRIEGRVQEFFVCADRRLMTVTTLGAAHFEDFSKFEQIQYEQREPGHLILRLQTHLTSLDQAQRKKIELAVRAKTQGGCAVSVELVPSIERTARGKHRLLIQHLALDNYFGASVEPHGIADGRV